MDLATVDDIEARLGRSLSSDEIGRVDALLADASANVRRVSTQQFTEATSTAVRVDVGRTGRVRLPQRPVAAVDAVTDIYGNAVSYTLVGNDLRLDLNPLNAWEIEPYRHGLSEVLVTYDHGSATVPPVIVGVVCAMVLRSLGNDPTNPAGIAQESIDGYSVTSGGGVAVATSAAAGGLGMLPSEIALCEEFRRPAGSIRVS